MSTIPLSRNPVAWLRRGKVPELPADVQAWLPVFAGLLVLYVPTYWTLANGLWQLDTYSYGPLVLAATLWLFWSVSRQPRESVDEDAQPVLGWCLVGSGLAAYVLGRILSTPFVDAGSQVPLVAGVLLVMGGLPLLRRFWFPMLFLAFVVPPPGFLLDAITLPLKSMVSVVVEYLLYWSGYPVGRNGVVLSIGPYYLLVADACSGLNSIFALCATGLLYLYMAGRQSAVRNAILLLSIFPIAFGANVVRVTGLALVTFYLGDEAGQGLVHKAGGLILFGVALALFFALDRLLGYVPPFRQPGAGP